MDKHFSTEAINESNFRLLSVASLLNKIDNGISIEELYREAERKFDTLVEILSGLHTDKKEIARFGYSMDELKEMSLFVFKRLISETSSNPYITLCVSEQASLDEIKRRRNRLLYIFHPDRNSDELTNVTTAMKINEAYEIISNKYYKAGNPFKYIKKRVPQYNPYRKKMMFALFIVFLIFILALLIMMKINNFI